MGGKFIFPEVRYKGVLTEAQVRDILSRADVNGDNHLSRAELKKAVTEMGSRLPPYRAWRSMQYADANHDGKISPSELDGLVDYLMGWYHGN